MNLLSDAVSARLGAQAEREDERRGLAARLFGPLLPAGADPVSVVTTVALHRDALARAGRCADEDDLLRLLEVAEAAGDEQLARAAAAVAFSRSWLETLDLFTTSRPAVAEDVDRLYLLASGWPNLGGDHSWR